MNSVSYFNQKQLIIEFYTSPCNKELCILNSDIFKNLLSKFIYEKIKINDKKIIYTYNIFEDNLDDLISSLTSLYEGKEEQRITKYFIDKFIEFWVGYERYATIYDYDSYIFINEKINYILFSLYNNINTSITKRKMVISRLSNIGFNASVLVNKIDYTPRYPILNNCKMVEEVCLKPPFISYSQSNKRNGIFNEVDSNPLLCAKINIDDYVCFSVLVGSNVAHVYCHYKFLALGISLANLFEIIPASDSRAKNPKLIYLFGNESFDKPVYYRDNDGLTIGVCPLDDAFEYFGYLKKMLLTMYNIRMIEKNKLPIHGACINIQLKNGVTKNIVIIGDSGAGKSETIDAFKTYAGDQISKITTVFDDMGTLKIINDEVYAYGTEIGAFVRLDDLDVGYPYREINNAIFLNPNQVNSRLVIPVSTYEEIMNGYKVDLVAYANNYENPTYDFLEFNDIDQAINCFKTGRRKAKGTTGEIGLVESFFANPFGPVQLKNETNILIDKYFNLLNENNILIAEMYTRLAVEGMEHSGPSKLAISLFNWINTFK